MNNNTINFVKRDGSQELVDTVPGIRINFSGSNNSVTIYEDTKFSNCSISLISNMTIEIHKSIFGIVNLRIFGNQSKIKIGRNFSCWGVEIRCHEQETAVFIGNECMFAEEILIYPTDVHTIFDQLTGEILNLGRPIVVGNHVWCGRGVTILKGGKISDDSVIASQSLITSTFKESNVIVGGSPAKVLKTGINWSRETPFDSERKRVSHSSVK